MGNTSSIINYKEITQNHKKLYIRENNNLFSFHQKTSVRILTARHTSYFHKKFKGSYENENGFLYLQVFYDELIDF